MIKLSQKWFRACYIKFQGLDKKLFFIVERLEEEGEEEKALWLDKPVINLRKSSDIDF